MGLVAPPPPFTYSVEVVGPKGVQIGSKSSFTAKYVGNYEFVTNWMIIENSGITTTLTDPNSTTCKVLVGNQGNSADGYFRLMARTSVKLPTGELICDGTTITKVYVRKLSNISAMPPVCRYININRPITLKTIRPQLGLQPNGVFFVGIKWEISDGQTFDYGPTAHGGAFNIIGSSVDIPLPNTTNFYRSALLSTTNLIGTQSAQNVSVKAVGMFVMQTVEYGIIPFESAPQYKYFEPLYINPTIPTNCPTAIIVGPDPAVKGIDNSISVSLSNPDLTFPALVEIHDARGLVVDKFEVESVPFTFDLTRFEPAQYQLVVDPNGINEWASFVIAKSGNDRIVVSPNPVFKDVDEKVTVTILDEQNQDHAFEVSVDDFNGLRHLSFGTENKSFELDVSTLDIGSYVLNVQGATTSFQENLELTMKGKPYFGLSPNPASSFVLGEIINPIGEDIDYRVSVVDKFGVVVKSFITKENPFSIDVSDLNPDIYYLHATEGFNNFSKIFSKF
jgi:hypothetical protein